MSISGFVDFLSSHAPAAALLVVLTYIAVVAFVYIIVRHLQD